ncbi:MAG: ethanolamine permease [Chitinophagaceae bacterium]|nr:MAG: ethanolamine permease [Chitinophagaceae bacterium]
MPVQQTSLKKVLGVTHLWAIAVGLVISGEYFGWNYGWSVAGTIGLLIATIIVTILYLTFVFSFTELTTSIPNAGGPFAYAYSAFGPVGGFIAGFATLVEFLLAAPAVAFALGGYLHFLYPSFDVLYTAIGCYVFFTVINLMGIKESAVFTLIVTILAVAGLLIYIGIITPHFRMDNFLHDDLLFGWKGVFAALPFAVWFYLAIEGVAMVAEEVKDPKRTIPKGYIYGIITLMFLALAVMILTGGITDWRRLSTIDHPLPEAVGLVLGPTSTFARLFTIIALFGLVASFHSVIIGYSRQIFALARSGYLPLLLAKVHPKSKTPHWALVAGGLIGVLAVISGTTDKLIILSALGAVVMYIVSMISLFVLRKKEPGMERPFKVPFYPWFPATALLLSFVCMVAIIYYNLFLSLMFFTAMIAGAVLFIIFYKSGKKNGEFIAANPS